MEEITKREQIEEKFKTSEQHYRRVFETARYGILTLNAKTGKIIDFNPYIRYLLGLFKDDLLDKQLREIETFKDVLENRDKFRGPAEEGSIRYAHLPLEKKSGKSLREFRQLNLHGRRSKGGTVQHKVYS